MLPEDTRGKRVEGPGMANLPEPCDTADGADHIVGRHSRPLVDDNESVHRSERRGEVGEHLFPDLNTEGDSRA